jgi:hypothetical protein
VATTIAARKLRIKLSLPMLPRLFEDRLFATITWTHSTILKYLNLLDGHESARHHPVKHRQEHVGFFLGVDNLDDDQQILREAYANVTIRFIGGFPAQRRFGGGRPMAFSPRSNYIETSHPR